MNAIKYNYDVKTKGLSVVEYKNSVVKTDKGWILKRGENPIKSRNIGRVCVELAYAGAPRILAVVLFEDSADTHMKWVKEEFKNFNCKEGFTMLNELN